MPVAEVNVARRREWTSLVLCYVVFAAVALFVVGRHLDTPGLYYDEVVQAEPAVQFLAVDGRPSQLPGARSTRLFGGWFPVMVQPYMGALKSQALIPVFALFGASGASLRLCTLVWSLLGLAFAMVFARNLLGARAAVVTGALLAVDPSFLFISRHDWGSFALGFLCRCAGLAFLAGGWPRRSTGLSFAGGLCFGLGIYNKIDFGVCVGALALALVAVRPKILSEAFESRGRRALPALLGLSLGSAPMLASAGSVFSTAARVARRQVLGAGDWSEKRHTFVTMLDGSYFHDLMLSGGSFERMFDEPGAKGLFLVAFVACALGLGIALWRDRRRGRLDTAQAFVWTATFAVALCLYLTPRAVRIHHTLNVYPFPQMLVAVALTRLFGTPFSHGPARALRRGAAVTALAAVLTASLAVDAKTSAMLQRSGGKGRWSDAIGAFGAELSREPGAIAVSMDWGFDGPLRFAARNLALVEPVWALRQARLPGRAWRFSGGPHHVYLVFEEDLSVFPSGPQFLDLARDLGADVVRIRRHFDREGDVAFLSVRFSGPHRLRYVSGFEVDRR